MISFDFGKTTAKRVFSKIFLEESYPVASPGAYTCSKKSLSLEFTKGNIHGAHLQKLLKRFATDVVEGVCVATKGSGRRSVFPRGQKLHPPAENNSCDIFRV